jgi:hypothetical protein
MSSKGHIGMEPPCPSPSTVEPTVLNDLVDVAWFIPMRYGLGLFAFHQGSAYFLYKGQIFLALQSLLQPFSSATLDRNSHRHL